MGNEFWAERIRDLEDDVFAANKTIERLTEELREIKEKLKVEVEHRDAIIHDLKEDKTGHVVFVVGFVYGDGGFTIIGVFSTQAEATQFADKIELGKSSYEDALEIYETRIGTGYKVEGGWVCVDQTAIKMVYFRHRG